MRRRLLAGFRAQRSDRIICIEIGAARSPTAGISDGRVRATAPDL